MKKVKCIKDAVTFKVGDIGLTDWEGPTDYRLYIEVKHFDVTVYESFSVSSMQYYFTFIEETLSSGYIGPKCECGASIAYGKECLDTFHSHYCPLYVGRK